MQIFALFFLLFFAPHNIFHFFFCFFLRCQFLWKCLLSFLHYFCSASFCDNFKLVFCPFFALSTFSPNFFGIFFMQCQFLWNFSTYILHFFVFCSQKFAQNFWGKNYSKILRDPYSFLKKIFWNFSLFFQIICHLILCTLLLYTP